MFRSWNKDESSEDQAKIFRPDSADKYMIYLDKKVLVFFFWRSSEDLSSWLFRQIHDLLGQEGAGWCRKSKEEEEEEEEEELPGSY